MAFIQENAQYVYFFYFTNGYIFALGVWNNDAFKKGIVSGWKFKWHKHMNTVVDGFAPCFLFNRLVSNGL